MMVTRYSADMMAADVIRKYRYLDETRTAALKEGDAKAYNRARAQQDVLADLLDKWDISVGRPPRGGRGYTLSLS